MDITNEINFGWFIRHRRDERMLSQPKLARITGLSIKTLSRAEGMAQPDLSVDSLDRLAAALGYADAKELDDAWRSSPVGRPESRRGPARSDSDVGGQSLPPQLLKAMALLAKQSGKPMDQVEEFFGFNREAASKYKKGGAGK